MSAFGNISSIQLEPTWNFGLEEPITWFITDKENEMNSSVDQQTRRRCATANLENTCYS